jgi:hypothetical protein
VIPRIFLFNFLLQSLTWQDLIQLYVVGTTEMATIALQLCKKVLEP